MQLNSPRSRGRNKIMFLLYFPGKDMDGTEG